MILGVLDVFDPLYQATIADVELVQHSTSPNCFNGNW